MSKNKKQVRANFRRSVFERDGWKCRRCGKPGHDRQSGGGFGLPLDAHHVIPRDAGGTYDVSNGITYCEGCHAIVEAESKYGECRECMEYRELTDGICEECQPREECPSCDGTGYSGDWSDEDGAEECDECDGTGVI